jgi:hypothetical protein
MAFTSAASRSCTATELLEHVVPALLLEHQVCLVFFLWWAKALSRVLGRRLAEFLERLVDVVLVDHDAGLGAASLGAKLGTQPVEVEFAVLEVRVGLELVPANFVSYVYTTDEGFRDIPNVVAADEVARAVFLGCSRLLSWLLWCGLLLILSGQAVVVVTTVPSLVHLSHEVSTRCRCRCR